MFSITFFICLIDIALVLLSFLLSSIIFLGRNSGFVYFQNNTATLFILIISYLSFYYFNDLYYFPKEYRTFKEYVRIISCVFATLISLVFLSFFIDVLKTSRQILSAQSFFVLLGTLATRSLISIIFSKGYFIKSAIIIGSGNAAKKIFSLLKKNSHANITTIGIITDGPVLKTLKRSNDPPLLGSVKWGDDTVSILGNTLNIPDVIEKYEPTLLILALNHNPPKNFNTDLLTCRLKGIDIITMQTLYERIQQEIPFKYIDTHWLLDGCIHQDKFATIRFKRVFDLFFSSVLLLFLSPFLLLAMLLIKASNLHESVFFLQERLGKNGNPFKIIKLRTMIPDAENDTGPIWAKNNDTRITKIGTFLRKIRIDEIPQLINILKGEMSLVGPRPEREVFIKDFLDKIPFYFLRLTVQPGLTGHAQVIYPYAASFDETENKFRCDLYYIKNMSITVDLVILFKTIKIIFSGKGL
ncbi:sugar transferase [Chlamydiota bacterium]